MTCNIFVTYFCSIRKEANFPLRGGGVWVEITIIFVFSFQIISPSSDSLRQKCGLAKGPELRGDIGHTTDDILGWRRGFGTERG